MFARNWGGGVNIFFRARNSHQVKDRLKSAKDRLKLVTIGAKIITLHNFIVLN